MSKTTIDRAALKAKVRDGAARFFSRLRRDYVFALAAVVVLASIAAVVQTLGTIFVRMPYPFALEWMEGSTMDHVRLVLAGKPIYRSPSFEWAPAIYPPLYYWTCAAFMKVFGVSLFWARFVSTCSVVGSYCLIAQFVRKEVGGVVGPILAVGFCAITFPISGAWVDLARVDSLFFVMFLGGAYAARHGTTRGTAALAGALLFLAFFAKQTALVLVVPTLFGSLLVSWRRGLLIGGVFAVLFVGAVQWMDLVSDGWFRFYVFGIAPKHSLAPVAEWPKALLFLLWEPMPIGVALALVLLVCGALPSWRVAMFYAGILAMAAFAGFSSYIKNGGAVNSIIPYCGVVAMLAGMTAGWAIRKRPESDLGRRLQAIVAAVALLQLFVNVYDQRKFVPRKRDLRSGLAMLEQWKTLRARGEVYSFGFGYYDAIVGGTEIHAHSMAIADLLRTGDPKDPNGPRISREFVEALNSRRYATVIWDESFRLVPASYEAALKANYVHKGDLFGPDQADHTWPKTAFGARPNGIWVRKDQP